MQNNTDIYGNVTTQKVSFAYGTIAQAAADTMPGSINFGYDAATKTGAIFMEKHLMTSRVLSMALGDAGIDGMHTVTVKFLNDANEVSEMTFKTVDESLIQMLIDGSEGGPVYMAGEYIDIDASTHAISVDYDPLYNKIKADLIAAGIGDQTEINIHQSEEILGIQKSYVKDIKKVETETGEKYVFTKSTKESETTDAVETDVVLDVVGTEKFDETISSVNAAVSAVDEKITDASNRIAEEINGLGSDIDVVKGRVDAVEEAVLDLSTNKADNTAVDEIKADIVVINSSVNALESEVAQLKSEVSVAWIDIHTLMGE